MSNTQQLVNEQIKAPFVLLVASDGSKYGKISTRDAVWKARQEGLDLVQVAPSQGGQPPVAKMVDFGKLRYKQAKQSKQHNHHDEVKEIRFGINIATHDLETKNKKVLELLQRKYKVKYTLEVKGRQKAAMGDALEYMKSLLLGFEESAVWTTPVVNDGRISSTLSPKGHS